MKMIIDSITKTITNFVKGGDTSDLELLNKVLHSDFRVTSNSFMGKVGVVVINKEQYLSNIGKGIFGGSPRTMVIETIDYFETIAYVKLRLESNENLFVSYNSLVLDVDKEWKLINNHALVTSK